MISIREIFAYEANVTCLPGWVLFLPSGRTVCAHVSTHTQCQILCCYTYRKVYAVCGMTVPHNNKA